MSSSLKVQDNISDIDIDIESECPFSNFSTILIRLHRDDSTLKLKLTMLYIHHYTMTGYLCMENC